MDEVIRKYRMNDRIEYKGIGTVKSDCDGVFLEGYASVFGVVDKVGDIVCKGAFARCLNKGGSEWPKLLWQHDLRNPIGRILELREDDVGLWVKCEIFTEVSSGKDAMVLVKQKVVDSFSIGFVPVIAKKRGGIRYLYQVKLYEISLVTLAAQEKALIQNVLG